MEAYSIKEQGEHNREFVNLQVHTAITKLFKSHLDILDQLEKNYQVPKEVKEEVRKRILDSGNDSIRDIHNLLDVFSFYIDPERLKAAKEQRKVVRKVVISSLVHLE